MGIAVFDLPQQSVCSCVPCRVYSAEERATIGVAFLFHSDDRRCSAPRCRGAEHGRCLLLHNLLSVNDIHTFRQVVQLALQTYATEGVDALLGGSVGIRGVYAR